MDAAAPPRRSTVNLSQKAGAADTKPSTKPRSGAANVKPRAAKPDPSASNNLKPAGAPKPSPSATTQMGPAQVDAIHRRAIQSIEGAEKGMLTARAGVQAAKSSKEDQNKVVTKANEVVGALLAPSRHVASLLSGLGALFPPCKQVGNSLAALIKHEIGQREKDVRVAIVHFDLARALVHIGSLNRKSRPVKSLGDPLNESLKNFRGLIQEFDQFCEAYYKTRAPESSLQHLLHWKSNKDSLNGFADRIAQLKKGLTSLLSQQAVQHPGEHIVALEQIDSRLAENRTFYATIRDANEEIAEAFLSNQGGQASARLVHDGNLLKQLAGVVGEGVVQGIASAIKKSSVTTLNNKKTTQQSGKGFFASKLQGTLDKLISGSQQKAQVDTKSGPHGPHEHIHKQVNNRHAPMPGHHSGHQQTKGNGKENSDQLQTSRVQDPPFSDTTAYQENGWYQDVTDDDGNIVEVFEGVVDQSGNWEGTDEQEPGSNSLDVWEYEYADGELEGDDDDDQVFSYVQEDEDTGNGVGGEGEYEYDEPHFQEEGREEEGQEIEYVVSEPAQPGGEDEGGQEPYYTQDDGSDDDADADSGQGGDSGPDYSSEDD